MTRDLPRPAAEQPHQLEPLAVDTVKIVVAGTALFALALVVTLLVPALHTGDRDWWPWACVSGLGLGLFGLAYIQRGRGNAASARRRRVESATASVPEDRSHSASAAGSADGRDTSTST